MKGPITYCFSDLTVFAACLYSCTDCIWRSGLTKAGTTGSCAVECDATEIRSTNVKIGQSPIYIFYVRCAWPFYTEIAYWQFGFESLDVSIYFASTSWRLLSNFIPYKAYCILSM